MNQHRDSDKVDDLFMKSFKYYKCNKPKPSLDNVVSTENPNVKISSSLPVDLKQDSRTEVLGLRNCSEWELFHSAIILIYSEENRNDFPEDLAELTDVIAQYMGHEKFKAEAAIVNYYHMNSTLSAHTDHSEVNLDAPLFSFSFGQSAIFLLGGKEKSIEPSAILLNSGDVVIMSKEARLCYHAVPKILPAKSSPWNEEQQIVENAPGFKYISNSQEMIDRMNINIEDVEWRKFQNYIAEARINMNVRQVLNETQKRLTELIVI